MDLRRHQRFPVHFHSMFTGPQREESVGTMVNLSKTGCRVKTTSQVYAGMYLALRFDVPGEEAAIRIDRAAVRWTRGDEIGVGFIALAADQQARLDQLLARLKQKL